MGFIQMILSLLADIPDAVIANPTIRMVEVETDGPLYGEYEGEQKVSTSNGWGVERVRFVEVPRSN